VKVVPVHTKKITQKDSLVDVLDASLPTLAENTVVAITSKIVSICEGSVVPTHKANKDELVARHAQWYLPQASSRYGVALTIANDTLVGSAGIDESNGDGNFILWPANPMKSATAIWQHVRNKHAVTNLGVIITDSIITPLRWGTRGIGIAWCGFEALSSYIDTPDVFGRSLLYTKASIVDGLAGAAVYAMGEGAEQTPIAVIERPTHITYQNRPPTPREIEKLRISRKDDLFEPLLTGVHWKKGES
jgi:putative folate metabolism gamma-glutamate ligase